jgi:YidC/Oxa1 family membrane protein insertase
MNEKRTWLAIGLSLAIYIGWQKFYLEPRMPSAGGGLSTQQSHDVQQTPASLSSPPLNNGQAAAPTVNSGAPVQVPAQTTTIELTNSKLTVGNGSRLIEDWVDSKYFQSVPLALFETPKLNQPKHPIDLAFVTEALQRSPSAKGAGQLDFSFDHPDFIYLNQVRGNLNSDGNKSLWTYEDERVQLTKTLEPGSDKNFAVVTLSGRFKGTRPQHLFFSIYGGSHKDDPEAQDRQFLYFTQNSLERVQIGEAVPPTQIPTAVSYIGMNSRYFLLALLPELTTTPSILQPIGPYRGKMSLIFPITSDTFAAKSKIYFGPKTLHALRSVDPLLDRTVDFGWFTVIAYPLLKILQWFNSFFNNYGIAIILLTLLLKIVTYPLTYTSMKSMKKMALVQPQLQALKEKYKDDKEALNRETMTLMREGGYNPVAGCLPMLVTMPVFFALYRVLYSSIELYQAPFALWIQDLSVKDPYYVTPIVLTITMFFQTKLTPNTSTDPVQAKMMQFMPLMFGAMMLTLPSGLTIYMLVNTVAGIGQQILLNRKFGTNPATSQMVAATSKP